MLKPNKFAGMISLCFGDSEMKWIACAFIFVFSTTVLAQQSDMQMKMPEPKPVEKAQALATRAPDDERDYIAALLKRYSNDSKADLKKLSADYSKAMGELTRKYPDDLDAATLYAESMMDLHPWQLWSADGKP